MEEAGQTRLWHARVRVLGPLHVDVQNAPLEQGRKAQRKPLGLLKVLIAYGGTAVDAAGIIEALWPDSERDGMKSLESALARLRKLLGKDETVLLREGKLTLNREEVWVDAWAFESLSAQLETPQLAERTADREDLAQRACALYRAPFLSGDPKLAWMLPMANRLHQFFLRALLLLGEGMERKKQWSRAVEIYERGLTVDYLSEHLYRRLMHCHAEAGEYAAALTAYRRCRESLSIILGVNPSTQTLGLHDEIRRKAG